MRNINTNNNNNGGKPSSLQRRRRGHSGSERQADLNRRTARQAVQPNGITTMPFGWLLSAAGAR